MWNHVRITRGKSIGESIHLVWSVSDIWLNFERYKWLLFCLFLFLISVPYKNMFTFVLMLTIHVIIYKIFIKYFICIHFFFILKIFLLYLNYLLLWNVGFFKVIFNFNKRTRDRIISSKFYKKMWEKTFFYMVYSTLSLHNKFCQWF